VGPSTGNERHDAPDNSNVAIPPAALEGCVIGSRARLSTASAPIATASQIAEIISKERAYFLGRSDSGRSQDTPLPLTDFEAIPMGTAILHRARLDLGSGRLPIHLVQLGPYLLPATDHSRNRSQEGTVHVLDRGELVSTGKSVSEIFSSLLPERVVLTREMSASELNAWSEGRIGQLGSSAFIRAGTDPYRDAESVIHLGTGFHFQGAGQQQVPFSFSREELQALASPERRQLQINIFPYASPRDDSPGPVVEYVFKSRSGEPPTAYQALLHAYQRAEKSLPRDRPSPIDQFEPSAKKLRSGSP
jgi:hypothetical protein